jgi:O-antigen/teichoic acid export membrane protein
LREPTEPRSIGAHFRIGSVFGIVLLAALLQVLSQVLLARGLPKESVGIIALILGALPLLSTISLLGQEPATVRFIARSSSNTHNIPAHIRRVLIAVVPLGIVAGIIAGLYYALAVLSILTLVTLVASQNVILLVSGVERARHHYERAMFLRQMPVVLMAVLFSAVFLAGRMNLASVQWSLVLSFAISVGLLVRTRGALREEVGSSGNLTQVPSSVPRQGLLFLGMGLSVSVMIALDKLIIGKMMTYSDLAVYATIFATMKGFDFLFYSIGYVLMPSAGSMARVRLGRYFGAITLLALALSAAYFFLGDDVVHVLYKGRYDSGAYLILPFILSGVFKLFYSIPSSLIVGRLPRVAMKQLRWLNFGALGANVVLDIVLILRWGLMGAAVGTAIAGGMRLAGGLLVLLRHRSHLGERPEGDAGGF